MKNKWFKQSGIFFFPATIPGWVVFLTAISYAVYSFIEIDSKSHSVSDTLMNFVFRLIIIGIVYSLFVFITNRTTDS
jgi:hypothetical protein